MTSISKRALVFFGLGVACFGQAQGPGWTICDAPMNPLSADYRLNSKADILMRIALGVSGTVTHGGDGGPCWDPSITGNGSGGMAFSVGSQGSIQTSFDDNLALVYGAPVEPAIPWCFATVNVNGTRTAFGSGGLGTVFPGASGRYIYEDSIVGGSLVALRCDVLGDAARLQWTFTNGDGADDLVGIWFGGFAAMVTADFPPSISGFGDGGYVTMPGRKPLKVQTRITRATDPNFPNYVQFWFDQAHAVGFQIDNGPTPSTSDTFGNSDADFVDEVAVGEDGFLIGGVSGNQTFSDVVLPDAFLGNLAFLQKFREKTVIDQQSVQFVHYFRAPWAVSSYAEPYSVVLDAPVLIQGDQSEANTGLFNDGNFTLGVNVDNSGRPGFAGIINPFPITTVRVAISFPDLPDGSTNGLSLAAGEIPFKNIPGNPALGPLEMKSVSFDCQADGIHSGQEPYVITVTPSAGPVKVLKGVVNVSATPRIHLLSSPAANLITAPWTFQDTSWESILGIDPSQFSAYVWDPQQQGYVVSSSAERGKSAFIVYNGSDPSFNSGSAWMQSNPQAPNADANTYPPQVRLHGGWNMIGSPWQYAFPLAQIVGVSDANNTQALSWQGLVDAGIVANYLAYWDPISGSYKYIQDINDPVQPTVGYWVYVLTVQDVTLQYPPVFAPGLGSGGGPHSHISASLLWNLQLSASGNNSKDSQNFIGSATDAKSAHDSLIRKPPVSPVGDVNLSILQSNGVQNIAYAKNYGVGLGAQTFKILVSSKKGGPVTITWPNLSSLPSSFQATLSDTSPVAKIDLRKTSSYTFVLQKGASKTLTIQTKAITPPMIITNLGNQLSGSKMTFFYKALVPSKSSAKVTTLSGQTVVDLTNNRTDPAGLRTITWNLMDSTGRPMKPGKYLFVVSSTNSAGQTDTKQLQFSR